MNKIHPLLKIGITKVKRYEVIQKKKLGRKNLMHQKYEKEMNTAI